MFSKQISVFVENKKGRLAKILASLKDNGINIRALCLADTQNYGILRFIASDTEKAQGVLKNEKMMFNVSDVLTVRMEDEAGSLCEILSVLALGDIDVEYAYAFVSKNENEAMAVIRTSDDKAAADVLKKKGYACQKG